MNTKPQATYDWDKIVLKQTDMLTEADTVTVVCIATSKVSRQISPEYLEFVCASPRTRTGRSVSTKELVECFTDMPPFKNWVFKLSRDGKYDWAWIVTLRGDHSANSDAVDAMMRAFQGRITSETAPLNERVHTVGLVNIIAHDGKRFKVSSDDLRKWGVL